MAMTPEHITEYETATTAHRSRKTDVVWSAWELGDLFRRDNYTVDEISSGIGMGKKTVRNYLDMARLSRVEIQNLIDSHGVDSLVRIRQELVRKGLASNPTTAEKNNYPTIRPLAPPSLVAGLTDKGYSKAAIRDFVNRALKALAQQETVVSHILETDARNVQITLTV